MPGSRRNATLTQPIDRAIALLNALASEARPLSITELAAMCHYPVPTVHRLAAQLEQRQLVKRALGSKKIVVGPTLVQLATATTAATMRSDQAHQILVGLAHKLGEACHIGVRSGDEIVYVDAARNRQAAGLQFEQGRRAPVHCTSIGKIYLAELTDADLDWWLAHSDLTKHAPATIVSKQKLKTVVKDARKNGWAASNEEFVPGVVGCAVPVRLANGKLLAGLGVSVPSARTSFAKVQSCVPFLKAAAEEIAGVSLA